MFSTPNKRQICHKDFFSSLADKLVSKLPKPSNKYGERYVSSYYENLNIESSFDLNTVEEESVKKILKDLKPSKAPGIDNITGRFLKDGATHFWLNYLGATSTPKETIILALPIAQLCNISISLSSISQTL